MRQPLGLGKLRVVTVIDSDHSREAGLGGDATHGFGEIVHGQMVRAASTEAMEFGPLHSPERSFS